MLLLDNPVPKNHKFLISTFQKGLFESEIKLRPIFPTPTLQVSVQRDKLDLELYFELFTPVISAWILTIQYLMVTASFLNSVSIMSTAMLEFFVALAINAL